MQFEAAWKMFPVCDHANFGLFVGLIGEYVLQGECKAHKTE